MPGEIAQGNLGPNAQYDIKFEGGQLVAELDAKLDKSSAGLVVKLDAGQVLDALAKAIPGTLDDAVFGVIKAALGSVK